VPAKPPTAGLGPREREIMEVLFRLRQGTAADVRERLQNAPSDSSVRTMLTLLESKGHVRHWREGRHFVYEPTVASEAAGGSALRHVVETFFGGSMDAVITTLVKQNRRKLSPKDVDRLAKLIAEAREP
jgi:predicted transcriptional regulator